MAPRASSIVLAGVLVLALVPTSADANLICPGCGVDETAQLSTSLLVELILSTVLRHGVAVLFAGAAFVVGVPWALAGFAVAVLGSLRRSRID